jgi:hypothetical protein
VLRCFIAESGRDRFLNRARWKDDVEKLVTTSEATERVVEAFHKRMLNDEMKVPVCANCATFVLEDYVTGAFSSYANVFLLPADEFEAFDPNAELRCVATQVRVGENMYRLHRQGIHLEDEANIRITLCKPCEKAARKLMEASYHVVDFPPLSLRHVDFGEIPPSLSRLTLVEQRLLAPYRKYYCILRLRFDQQCALRGHVIAIQHDGPDVVAGLMGIPMLHPEVVDPQVKIVMVGTQKQIGEFRERIARSRPSDPNERKRPTHNEFDACIVRPEVLIQWYCFLHHSGHPAYRYMPDERTWANVTRRLNGVVNTMLERDVLEIAMTKEQPEAGDHKDPRNVGDDCARPNVGANLTFSAVVDPAAEESEDDRIVTQVAKMFKVNLRHRDQLAGVSVRTAQRLEDDFTWDYWTNCYPWLFPRGVTFHDLPFKSGVRRPRAGADGDHAGVADDIEAGAVRLPNIRKHAPALLSHVSGRFSDPTFVLHLADSKRRHETMIATSNTFRVVPTLKDEFIKWFVEEQKTIRDALESNDSASIAPILAKIRRYIITGSSRLQWTPGHRHQALNQMWAMRIRFGMPNVFLTVSPDEKAIALLGKLLRQATEANFDEGTVTNDAAARHPGLTAVALAQFSAALQDDLLSCKPHARRKRAEDPEAGVLSEVVAGYVVAEMQSRGTVHWHAIYKIPIPVEVIDEAASDASLAEALARLFDSIASATLKGGDGGVETALAPEDLDRIKADLDGGKPPRSADEIRVAAEHAASRTQKHEHSHTCRKGPYGHACCRMGMPVALRQLPTGPVELTLTRPLAEILTDPATEVEVRSHNAHFDPPCDNIEELRGYAKAPRVRRELPAILHPVRVGGPTVTWDMYRPNEEDADIVDYNDTLCAVTQSNNCVRLLTTSTAASAALFYIASYMTKDGFRDNFAFSTLQAGYEKGLFTDRSSAPDAEEDDRMVKFMYNKLLNIAASSTYELSSQASALYLLGEPSMTSSSDYERIWVDGAVIVGFRIDALDQLDERIVVVDSPCEAVNGGGDDDHGDSDDDACNSEADCNPLEGLFSSDDESDAGAAAKQTRRTRRVPESDSEDDGEAAPTADFRGDHSVGEGTHAPVFTVTDESEEGVPPQLHERPELIHNYVHRPHALSELSLYEFCAAYRVLKMSTSDLERYHRFKDVLEEKRKAFPDDADAERETYIHLRDAEKKGGQGRPSNTKFYLRPTHPACESWMLQVRSKFATPRFVGRDLGRVRQLRGSKKRRARGYAAAAALFIPWELTEGGAERDLISWASSGPSDVESDQYIVFRARLAWIRDFLDSLGVSRIVRRMLNAWRYRSARRWHEPRRIGTGNTATAPVACRPATIHSDDLISALARAGEAAENDGPEGRNAVALGVAETIWGIAQSDCPADNPHGHTELRQRRRERAAELEATVESMIATDQVRALADLKKAVDDEMASKPTASTKQTDRLLSEHAVRPSDDVPVRHQVAVTGATGDLSQDQQEVLTRLGAFFDQVLHGDYSNAPRVLVHGGPGTGKSYLIQQIVRSAASRDLHVLVTAATGSAAALLGSVTLHSAVGMQRPSRGGRATRGPNSEARNKVRERLLGSVLLIVDEISMIGTTLLYELKRILHSHTVGRPGVTQPCKDEYGNIGVLLVGDPFQLPPVGSPTLFSPKCPYLQSFVLMPLTTQQRAARDPAWAAFIASMSRAPRVMMHEFRMNIRCFKRDRDGGGFADAAVVVNDNEMRHVINFERMKRKAREWGLPIIRWKAEVAGDADKSANEVRMILDSKWYENHPGRYGYFLCGAPGIITANQVPLAGIANGTPVEYRAVRYTRPDDQLELSTAIDEWHATSAKRWQNGSDLHDEELFVDVRKMPDYLLVAACATQLSQAMLARDPFGDPDHPAVLVWLAATLLDDKDSTIRVRGKKGRLHCVRFHGFPCDFRFAVTFHRVQGQTCEKVVVVMSSRVSLAHLYVGLTRVRTSADLRIIVPPGAAKDGFEWPSVVWQWAVKNKLVVSTVMSNEPLQPPIKVRAKAPTTTVVEAIATAPVPSRPGKTQTQRRKASAASTHGEIRSPRSKVARPEQISACAPNVARNPLPRRTDRIIPLPRAVGDNICYSNAVCQLLLLLPAPDVARDSVTIALRTLHGLQRDWQNSTDLATQLPAQAAAVIARLRRTVSAPNRNFADRAQQHDAQEFLRKVMDNTRAYRAHVAVAVHAQRVVTCTHGGESTFDVAPAPGDGLLWFGFPEDIDGTPRSPFRFVNPEITVINDNDILEAGHCDANGRYQPCPGATSRMRTWTISRGDFVFVAAKRLVRHLFPVDITVKRTNSVAYSIDGLDLIGYAVHLGGANGGHYAAVVKHALTGSWVLCDDEHIHDTRESNLDAAILQLPGNMWPGQGYIFLYRVLHPGTAIGHQRPPNRVIEPPIELSQ